MSYHQRVPSLLGLSRWFCKNVRMLIYRKLAVCDIVAVKVSHGMSISRHEAEKTLHSTHSLDLFKTITAYYMLDGRCTLRLHIDSIASNTIMRNDVEFVKHLHSMGACVQMDDLKSPTVEMFEFVCKHAYKRTCTNSSVTITPEMLAVLHANGYYENEISDYGVGMGCTKDEIVKYVGAKDMNETDVIRGVITSNRWELLMDMWDDKLSNELYTSDIHGIIQYAPASVCVRVVTPQHVNEDSATHVYAWLHSPERALWVLKYADPIERIPAYDESHAQWIIAQGCIPTRWKNSKDATWQLDVGVLFAEQWETFPVAYYDRMHALMPLPKEFTSFMSYGQARWLYAHGVHPSYFILARVCEYEYVKWLLSIGAKYDMQFDILGHEPRTVELLCEYGWKPQDHYLDNVMRVDTFRWMLAKFGAYPEIYRLIDSMSPLLYEEVYAQCKPPPYAMWYTRCIDTVQWFHKKGLVWPNERPLHRINDIGDDFMQKHFGEPWDCIPANK